MVVNQKNVLLIGRKMNNDNFAVDLTTLINKYGINNELNTSGYILASYIRDCLIAFECAMKEKDKIHSYSTQYSIQDIYE